MIIYLFLLLFAIAIACIAYGEATHEVSYTVVGCCVLFILSAWVLFGKFTGKDTSGIQYKIGENITSYGNAAQNASYNITTITRDVYASYDDTTTFWVGIILSIMSSIGIILAFIPKKR